MVAQCASISASSVCRSSHGRCSAAPNRWLHFDLQPCLLPQALLRGVQLPADTYDRTHELRLYNKVAETLNADIERNKLATFATVGEFFGLQP